MEKPVLLSGGFGPIAVWSVAAILVVCTLATLCSFFVKNGQGIAAAAAVPLLLIGVGACFMIARPRRWLAVLADETGVTGFQVTSRSGNQEVALADLTDMALKGERIFSDGELKSFARTCSVWRRGEKLPIVFKYRYFAAAADPLESLIDAIVRRLHDQCRIRLEAGGDLVGDGWRLTDDQLEYGAASLPIANMTAIGFHDEHLCVWEDGREEPNWRSPAGGKNCFLLGLLLSERVSATRAEASDGLGRVLFERKPSPSLTRMLWIIGGVCMLAGSLLIATVPAAAASLLGVGAVLTFIVYLLRNQRFRGHERGVARRTAFRSTRLLYLDVATVTFKAQKHYHHGAYIGTNFSLRFTPVPGEGRSPIRFSTSRAGSDAELESTRDYAASIVASRLADQMKSAGAVDWTANLRLQADGLVYRPRKLWRRLPEKQLPYVRISHWNIDGGVFRVWEPGVKAAVVSESTASENFFPGYILFNLILKPESDAGSLPAPPENQWSGVGTQLV